MLITNVSNNGVNETGVYNESLSQVVRRCGSSPHQASVRKKWSAQYNICVMTCYYQSQPGVRGYRHRLHAFWKEKGLFQVGD